MRESKINLGKSLAETNPELAKQWHSNKNGNLTPYDVKPGSSKKAWWKCPKGDDHEWEARIGHRNNGVGCPICSGKKVINSNCLATLYPKIANEWHSTRNGDLTPQDITPYSNKVVWWKCPKGNDHEWKTSVGHRINGTGCPICSNRKVVKDNSLYTLNPQLAKEWHPTKNEKLTPYEVTPGSHEKVWWQCKDCGHEWQSPIKERNKGLGCGVCANKITVKANSFGTLCPELAKEWHATKNGILTPFDLVPGSNKKVWWKCPNGDDHEWQTSIATRNKGIGCPICSNHKVVKSNCLATLNPKLAKEWHPTKNGNLTPYGVTSGSQKKVWWKCSRGDDHAWKASVANRKKGQGCPICSNKKTVKSNCLAVLNPELAKEWHPTKNGKITPYDVTPGSSKTVWWKCPKGDEHEWEARIDHRNNGIGCLICSNRKIIKSNSLAMINPDLSREWHPTKNGTLTPYDVAPSSGKQVWWKCPKEDDHEWEARIDSRQKGNGCAICANLKIVKSNCLATLAPKLAKEWHPTKNEKLTPYNVSPESHKKAWWKCSKRPDHVWQASIKARNNGTGCPICNDNSSAPELRIFSELKTIFPSTQHRSILKGYEVDIYIPEIQFGIEYDGAYWHRDTIQKDQKKNTALNSTLLLIRIREKGLSKITNTDIELKTKDISVKLIKQILQLILKYRQLESPNILDKIHDYFKCSDWIASDRFNKLLTERNNINYEKSFGSLFPDIAKEWHPTKNDPLLPEHFLPGSHKKVWWQCKCGHDWQATVASRSSGTGCPMCRAKKTRKTLIQKKKSPGQLDLINNN